jgi:pseudaminic acid biosynthesis-associated methylase
MSDKSKQIDAWRGDFGDNYTDRNTADPMRLENSSRAFREILGHVKDDPPRSILEVGANLGANIRALKSVTDAELHAVEPNGKARDIMVSDDVLPAARVVDATASNLPFSDGQIDLVFTAGVLIHIPHDNIEAAYREMHRVAGRFLLSIEYFSPTPVEVPYRGETDLLFKRDFGGLWLDLFDDLEHVANGFFWKRTTGLDDVTWWLFRKK